MWPTLRKPRKGFTVATGEVSVKPKPSAIFAPVKSSKRFCTSSGSGALPLKQYFTVDKSNFSTPGN